MNVKVQLNTGRDDAFLRFLNTVSKNNRGRCANELTKIGYLFSQRQAVDFSLVERYERTGLSNDCGGDSLTLYLKLTAPTTQLLENVLVTDRAEMVRRLISLGFLAYENKNSLLSILPAPEITILKPSLASQVSKKIDTEEEDSIVDYFS
jgi:hypothetical protein